MDQRNDAKNQPERVVRILVDGPTRGKSKSAIPGVDWLADSTLRIGVESLKGEVAKALENVWEMLAGVRLEDGQLEVHSIKFSLHIDNSGEVSIVSLAKGGTSGRTGIEFTIQRRTHRTNGTGTGQDGLSRRSNAMKHTNRGIQFFEKQQESIYHRRGISTSKEQIAEDMLEQHSPLYRALIAQEKYKKIGNAFRDFWLNVLQKDKPSMSRFEDPAWYELMDYLCEEIEKSKEGLPFPLPSRPTLVHCRPVG